MNDKNRSLVFLCDEYGIISGVLTIGEIIAELFGELGGEEEEEQAIKVLSSERFIVAGSASLAEVNRVVGVELEKGDCDTIGGFLYYRLGEIPTKGTVYREKEVVFEVLKRHRLAPSKKIEITKLKKTENG